MSTQFAHPQRLLHSGAARVELGSSKKLQLIWMMLLGLAAFFAICFVGKYGDRTISLCAVTFAGIVGIMVPLIGFAQPIVGRKVISIALAAFVLRMGLGLLHNHLYLDENYFVQDTTFVHQNDFEWLDRSMTLVASNWEKNGFGSPLPDSYWEQNKNSYMNLYNGMLYYFAGTGKHLNFTAWNSMHSIMVAIITMCMCLLSGASKKSAIFVFTLMCFHPFGMYSDILWRDNAGQFLIYLGVYLMLAFRGKVVPFVAATAVASFLAFTVRQPYLMVVIAGGAVMHVTLRRSVATSTFVISLLLMLAMLSLNAHRFVLDAAVSRFQGRGYAFATPLSLPFRFVRAMLGYFPWTQMFSDDIPNYHMHPMHYLTHVFNMALIMVVIRRFYQNLRRKSRVDGMVLFGAGFFLTGLVAPAIHTPYLNLGLPFLFCFAATECNLEKRWWRLFFYSFGIFLVLNAVFLALGMSGKGLMRGLIY